MKNINPLEKADTVVIYHSPCMDGFTSAYVAYQGLAQSGAKPYFHPGAYGVAPPDVDGRDVYLLDFSYKRPVLEALAKKAKQVTILDHHDSAMKDLAPLLKEGVVKGRFDMQKSGATLTWDHFFGGEPTPEGVLYIEDRDLWTNKMPQSQAVSRVVGSYLMEPTKEAFKTWGDALYDVEKLRAEAVPVGRFMDSMVRLYTQGQHTLPVQFKGKIIEVPACNTPFFLSSEVGDELLKQHPKAPMSVCWCLGKVDNSNPNSPNCVQFSLRSRDANECNVAEIATAMGGGGHPKASGFKLTGDAIKNFCAPLAMIPHG